jgi:DNA-binding NarL/FixJ family response regulator
MAISVLIVEDEPAFLKLFSDAVLAEPRLQLVGAVSTVAGARALIDVMAPDVVVTDLGLPDGSGVDVVRHAVQRRADIDVLVVTMFGDDVHVIDSLAAGATGYLMKDAMPGRISASILEVHAGGAPISPSIARRVLQRFRMAATATAMPQSAPDVPEGAPEAGDPGTALTARETDILRLVAKGLSFGDVGGALDISPHTVVTHVKRIYRKLAVHSRGEAVFEARVLGLL